LLTTKVIFEFVLEVQILTILMWKIPVWQISFRVAKVSTFYFVPGRGLKYCDQCVEVCMFNSQIWTRTHQEMRWRTWTFMQCARELSLLSSCALFIGVTKLKTEWQQRWTWDDFTTQPDPPHAGSKPTQYDRRRSCGGPDSHKSFVGCSVARTPRKFHWNKLNPWAAL